MTVRVGTDIVRVSRLAAVVTARGSAFLDLVFTSAERADTGDVALRLAGRWAAKESVLKALGVGVGEVPMRDVEVLLLPSGAPQLHLHAAAESTAAALGLTQWSVSISHDGDYATAVVAASGD